MSRAPRGGGRRAPAGRGRRPGGLGALAGILVLLGSLFVVTWRQTRGLAMEEELRKLQSQRAMAEAERVELVRQVEQLRSRARIVRVARERLGMHLPTDREIVFLPIPRPVVAQAGGER